MSKEIKTMTLIRNDETLYKKLHTFLLKRGREFYGGCIMEDGTVFIGLEDHGQATYGSLGKDLKKFLKVDKLVLGGVMY